ncbi:MAG: epsF, partial [Rhizobacter sp.]|nr:epsF [Rhizobacter sp.]
SAAVANAFVKAYIDTTVTLRSEPAKQYNSFFDERAAQLRSQLEKAQAKLSAYQQKNGIVATDEKLDVENQRLAELTTQLTVLQGQATDSSTRNAAGTNVGQMQEVLTNPLLLGLTSDLSRLESRLGELRATLGENNPQVGQVRSSIREVRARIDSETARIKGGLSVSDKINQSRLGELRASVADQRNKLLKLKGQRDEASVMIRDVENAQRSYDTIVSRATQSSVESQATQTNVSILRYAQPPSPSQQSSPKVLLNSLVGVFIGALLALSIVLIRETFDRRLRTNMEVQQLLKVPLLGVLPVGARAASKGRSRLRLTTNRPTPALTNSR